MPPARRSAARVERFGDRLLRTRLAGLDSIRHPGTFAEREAESGTEQKCGSTSNSRTSREASELSGSMILMLPPHGRASPLPPFLTLTARVSCSSHAGFTGVHDQFATQGGDAPHRPVKSAWPLSPFRFSAVGEEIGEEAAC